MIKNVRNFLTQDGAWSRKEMLRRISKQENQDDISNDLISEYKEGNVCTTVFTPHFGVLFLKGNLNA